MLPVVDIERTKEEFIVSLQAKLNWLTVYDLERFFLGQLTIDEHENVYNTLNVSLENTDAYIEEVKTIYF